MNNEKKKVDQNALGQWLQNQWELDQSARIPDQTAFGKPFQLPPWYVTVGGSCPVNEGSLGVHRGMSETSRRENQPIVPTIKCVG